MSVCFINAKNYSENYEKYNDKKYFHQSSISGSLAHYTIKELFTEWKTSRDHSESEMKTRTFHRSSGIVE